MGIIFLDTDILINFLRGAEKGKLYVQTAASNGVPGGSAIPVAEIYAGLRAHEKGNHFFFVNKLAPQDIGKLSS